ncbi:hypothetical protein [Paracoccus spongiarum]|uniref:Uncharacterized protein n=1 Tax=Paracoccus spongiarum TaxID=3064387 RepID=A0ABT9JEW9_9RHOB|nr:hypothetical protein [Paracoccus sp. 2205BS29-5]MDP5308373.1 hypothetical protein [Paracoccus sp. 2205BS29-5]
MAEPGDLARADPKNLIRESFRIEGIGAGECRSIFLDWALSLPPDIDPAAAIRLLLGHYAPNAGSGPQPHPMVSVLLEGSCQPVDAPRRRGGRAARVPRCE